MPENHFILYFEFKNPDIEGAKNSKVMHCDTLPDLVYQLRECINQKHQNVKINTIENAKPKLND